MNQQQVKRSITSATVKQGNQQKMKATKTQYLCHRLSQTEHEGLAITGNNKKYGKIIYQKIRKHSKGKEVTLQL